ncbi:hypothetical protein AOLI_G00077970 [Acnodon oligacanthus]
MQICRCMARAHHEELISRQKPVDWNVTRVHTGNSFFKANLLGRHLSPAHSALRRCAVKWMLRTGLDLIGGLNRRTRAERQASRSCGHICQTLAVSGLAGFQNLWLFSWTPFHAASVRRSRLVAEISRTILSLHVETR